MSTFCKFKLISENKSAITQIVVSQDNLNIKIKFQHDKKCNVLCLKN